MRTLSFYFDFVSPYAYLSFKRVVRNAKYYDLVLEPWPVDLAALKLMAGNTGPATRDIPIKLKHLRVDMQRWASLSGLPLTPPQGYGSGRLNKGAFFALDQGQAIPYIHAAWALVWGQGWAMNDDATLKEAARGMGWDDQRFQAYVSSEEAALRLEESTRLAHERGVFGVPSLLLDDEMWWGNDRLALFEAYLEGITKEQRGVE